IRFKEYSSTMARFSGIFERCQRSAACWLRPLIESLEEIPGAAMAGSMLLNRDGSIQDAGWRMMQNGWGYPIGRGDDPLNGAYTYRREVDCVTGACFLVSQKVFNELGGFDAAYAPAFYEEFDLAFRIRERGLKVIFEPRSRIVHLGSASYGAEQRDQLTKQNQAKFIERFADKLSKQPEEATDEFLLRKTFAKGPVILFVDLSVPHPDRHAGDVTMYRYLTLFAESGWHVIFSPFDGQADDSAAEALEKQGIELIRNPWSIEGWLPEQGKHLDFVWLSRPEIAETLIETIRAHSSARVYYYTHDLHYLRFEREAKLRGGNATLEAEAKRFFKLETGLFDRVDLVISPSEIENEVIKSLVPGKPVATLPPFFYEQHEIKVRNADHFAKYSDIVFIGGFPHTPNVDAALFIAREVMPIVWRDCPKARLILVGYKPPPEVQALAKARVVVTGQVPEVAPFLETARVFLAPLRFGAGVKGKIIQALQYGVPVVTSPIGIEGTSIQPGCEALVAVDAQGFAEAVISLLHDPDRCASLSAAGIELIGKKFSRNAAKSAIEQIFHMPRCGR
ncbi:MAG: glycosyltransferase, partial [Gammaproteobacteria bacterium]